MAKDDKQKKELYDLKKEAGKVPGLESKVSELTGKMEVSTGKISTAETDLKNANSRISELEKGGKDQDSEKVKSLELKLKEMSANMQSLEKRAGKINGDFPTVLSPPGGRVLSEVQLDKEGTIKRAMILESKDKSGAKLLLQMKIVDGKCEDADYSVMA